MGVGLYEAEEAASVASMALGAAEPSAADPPLAAMLPAAALVEEEDTAAAAATEEAESSAVETAPSAPTYGAPAFRVAPVETPPECRPICWCAEAAAAATATAEEEWLPRLVWPR